jgi:serine protease Do
VIISFDSKPIREMRDLPRLVADTPVEKSVPVVVIRTGAKQTFNVTLGRLEEGEKLAEAAVPAPDSTAVEPESLDVLGMKIAALSEDLRKKYKIQPQVEGVVVLSVTQDSPASAAHIAAGEVIVEADYKPVHLPKDVADRVEQLQKNKKKAIFARVLSLDGDLRFIAVKLSQG